MIPSPLVGEGGGEGESFYGVHALLERQPLNPLNIIKKIRDNFSPVFHLLAESHAEPCSHHLLSMIRRSDPGSHSNDIRIVDYLCPLG